MKDPNDKDKWIIDEPAAEVVRRIFTLCMDGGNLPKVPGKWVQTCVADMLEHREYVGDTVNFRSTTVSFKNHTKVHIPEEEWAIFENTHPAIIDRHTFAVVQEPYRKDKRRHQELDIYYRGVGLVHIPNPDEMEQLYQESMENHKQKQGKDSATEKAEEAESVPHHKQNNEKTA